METDENIKYKTCSKCKKTKPTSEFHKRKRNKGRLVSHCKDCIKEYGKKYREINSKRIKEHQKKCRRTNPEKVKEYYKKWREANPEKIKEYAKKWKEINPEKAKENVKKCRRANLEYYKEYSNQYIQNRKATDSLFKLRHNIKILIRDSLNKQNYTKNSKAYNILGIGYKGLLNWLNEEASNGLSYEDNNIHLDHVIPISLGKTEEEILALNHFSNYQLLNSEENRMKHNYYINKDNLNRVLKYHLSPKILKNIIDKNKIEIKEE